MPWPTPQDYNEAMQDPVSCFKDKCLAVAEVRCDRFGMPRAESGNFASVYRLMHGEEVWAVRCFLYQIANRENRYRAISDYLSTPDLPFILPFKYVPDGIRVGASHYPMVKMQYLDAYPLNQYLSMIAGRTDLLMSLIGQLESMSKVFHEQGMAHGDLQHDNILVHKGLIYLVDYDAMFVPELAGSAANELGHPAYQHPSKASKNFDASMDNFSFWIIKNSLSIINEDPDILQLLSKQNDGLLFSSADLRNPQNSRLFHYLESPHQTESVRLASRQIRALLCHSIEELPRLSDECGMDILLELTPDLKERDWSSEDPGQDQGLSQEYGLSTESVNSLEPRQLLERMRTQALLQGPLSQMRNKEFALNEIYGKQANSNPNSSSISNCSSINPLNLPEESFGNKIRHRWPEIFNHESYFGYDRLNELIQKRLPIAGEPPFLPPVLATLFEEHGVLLVMMMLTLYTCLFLCQSTVTLCVLLTVLGLTILVTPHIVLSYLTCVDTLRRGPRGRFLNRVADILYDGKCTLVKFRVVGPIYERKIIFESGLPSHLNKGPYRVQNSAVDKLFDSPLFCETETSKIGMLYMDRGHTEVPIALCGEGNTLIWLI